jgi:hypothetical protein
MMQDVRFKGSAQLIAGRGVGCERPVHAGRDLVHTIDHDHVQQVLFAVNVVIKRRDMHIEGIRDLP